MAFIREYAAAGDPFKLRLPKKLRKRFKLPKAIRKFQPGKALKSLAPIAASFIPGVGGIAAQIGAGSLAPAPVSTYDLPEAEPVPVPVPVPMEEEEPAPMVPDWMSFLMAADPRFSSFARSYGFDMGDPGGKGGSRRKQAGAGTKAKAQTKRAKRTQKAATRATLPAPKGKGKGPGIDWGAVLGGAASMLGRGAGGLSKRIDMTQFDPSVLGGIAGGGFKGARGARRSTNPANVKALRRALRRVEGFEKLVKRVEKQYPRLKRAVGHAPAPARARKRCA